jgi:nitroreductase
MIGMTVAEALKSRFSTRAYLDKPVAPEKIHRILDAARCAPSGTNTQPWQVAVVSGEAKRELGERLVSTFQSGEKPQMDYRYYPVEWKEPFKGRRKACGLQLYETLGIRREDKERRLEQWIANYRAFDAPMALFFFMDSDLETGSFMDYGMFLQSVMLMAAEEGLATCPQASLGEYPAVVKEFLGVPNDTVLVCGMALGYPDPGAPVNQYRTPREPVEAFTRFFP